MLPLKIHHMLDACIPLQSSCHDSSAVVCDIIDLSKNLKKTHFVFVFRKGNVTDIWVNLLNLTKPLQVY